MRHFISRFLRHEDGSISVEAMLVLPMLMWAYLGTFVFFDAYRSQSTNIKAAYTLGDTISRETNYITPAYMDSLYELQQFLVSTDQDVRLRVTIYRYQEGDDTYRVRWSQSRGMASLPMTDAGLAAVRPALPVMPDGEVAILVQTWVGYHPRYSVGLNDFVFEDLVVTRPRFTGQVCWNSVNNGDETTATC